MNMTREQTERSWAGQEDEDMGLGIMRIFSSCWKTSLKAEANNFGFCKSQHTREPLPPPHLPHQPQVLSPLTLRSTSSRKQSRKAAGYWRKNRPGVGKGE